FISRLVRNIITRISDPKSGRTSPVFYTLGRLSHYIIIIIGIILALASIGLNFTNIAIVAGALSVGIGFGLQSIVNNFVSGIIVLFEQNIKVGDFVQLDSGMTGVVKGIHVRSTVITTLDNLDIIVPNSELVTAKVVNYTMNEPMFRIHVPFGVAYGSNKTEVEKAGLEAARKVEVTYDDGAKRRPQVWLVGFGDSSLDFELIVWVVNKLGNHATPGSWKALYTWEIETALHKYGIEIPFPQRDLHLRSGFTDTKSQPEI
ncbi:MAG: mechanosensitive ion channel, partial [Gammaproteobacteria bacterium]